MKSLVSHIRTPSQLISALKRCRKKIGYTQAEMGESAGLPQTTVSKIEVELVDPSLTTIFKILAALNLEIELKERRVSQNGSHSQNSKP